MFFWGEGQGQIDRKLKVLLCSPLLLGSFTASGAALMKDLAEFAAESGQLRLY